jgi:DNA-directed RNA polymerase specialized sigma24 family protein
VVVFDQLDREWRRLATSAPAAQHLADVCHVAGGAPSLGELERYVRAADAPTADAVLAALVARAVRGDRLAARVLLQLLLLGVRRLARTWWALGDAEERAAAAVAAVYERIRRYPLARRPHRIAANVLMDAAHDLRRATRSGYVADAGLPAAFEPPARPSTHPGLELAEVLADAVGEGLISSSDAQLIAASRIAGTPLREIARRSGAKLRTLQWRRQQAEAVLTGAAPAA